MPQARPVAGSRLTRLEEAYQHFKLDRQAMPVARSTLNLYDWTIGAFLRWVSLMHPEVRSFEELDVLVVGSGVAGLSVAVRLADAGLAVGVVTKAELSVSATRWAQGGVAAVLGADEGRRRWGPLRDAVARILENRVS